MEVLPSRRGIHLSPKVAEIQPILLSRVLCLQGVRV